MKPVKLVNSYVYVVLEYHSETTDPRVHGVYINKEEADGKRDRLLFGKTKDLIHTPATAKNYVAVLKKPLKGKERDVGDFLTGS
jgi:hypothetical protein